MHYKLSKKEIKKCKKDELYKNLINEFVESESYGQFKINSFIKYNYDKFFAFDMFWWHNFIMTHKDFFNFIKSGWFTCIFSYIFCSISDILFNSILPGISLIVIVFIFVLLFLEKYINISSKIESEQKYFDENKHHLQI